MLQMRWPESSETDDNDEVRELRIKKIAKDLVLIARTI